VSQSERRTYAKTIGRRILLASLLSGPIFVGSLLIWANSAWMLVMSISNGRGIGWVALTLLLCVLNLALFIFGIKQLEGIGKQIALESPQRRYFLLVALVPITMIVANLVLLIILNPPYNQIHLLSIASGYILSQS
jgi:hypothetical protein